jgi:hypothetical protein
MNQTLSHNFIQKPTTLLQRPAVRRGIAISMIVIMTVFAGLYLFFLGSTTMYISQRKHLQEEIRGAHSHLADLETEFFSSSQDLDLEYLATLGFAEAQAVSFAQRATDAETVAFRVE